MSSQARAGTAANVASVGALRDAYYDRRPDTADPAQRERYESRSASRM